MLFQFHGRNCISLSIIAIAIIFHSKASEAADFNTSFLLGDAASIDWSSAGRKILPGIYNFDIYINGEWDGKYKTQITDEDKIQISREAVASLSIRDVEKILTDDATGDWVNLELLTHGGELSLNSALLRVDLTIPQAYVSKKDKRWISPSQWDQGINGLYSAYNASYYHAWRRDGISDTDNIYLTLNSGLNLAGWHLIDNSVFRKNRANSNGYWANNERYIERALTKFHSVFRLGESNTESNLFDNLRFRGVTLKQEPRMYPDIYRTYMPIIRGIAKSNAAVRVYQNNIVIYQINVPPGPFEITELMPSGSRSAMTVIVQEADGSKESFTVPYSTISDMLRAGSSEWQVNAGQVSIRNIDNHPDFLQGNFSHGINNYLTLYAGGTLSEKYQSLLGGGAFSIPHLGSFSVNADTANTNLDDGSHYQGQRYKISWSRYFPTQTNLTLATYYYNTQDYLSFTDAVKINSLIFRGYSTSGYLRDKQKYNINLEQPLPNDLGKLSLRGEWRTYWNSAQKTRSYLATYSNSWRDVTYSVAISRTHYEYDADDDSYEYDESNYGSKRYDENQINLSVTVPLSIFDTRVNVTNNMAAKNGKYSSLNTGISGATQSMDYSVNLMDSHTSSQRSGSFFASWHAPMSNMTGSYTEATSYRQAGASASGTVLLWRDGLLASGQTGNTFVILDAPGASGAIVNGNTRMRTNRHGQVLVPSAAAYRMNNFRLTYDNKSNDGGAEILGNVGHTAPWYGSISYVQYKTDRRKVFVFNGELEGGKRLPFGATVLNKKHEEIGYVAQGSQLYVKAETLPNAVYVKFTDDSSRKVHLCILAQPSEEQGAHNECRIEK